MFTRNLRAAMTCALLSTTAISAPAFAQVVSSPTFRQTDENGVDLVRGDVIKNFTEGSIGSGAGELKLVRTLGLGSPGTNQWDRIRLTVSGSNIYVDFGLRNDKFPGAESRGAKISGSGASYQYTSADGTVIAFQNTLAGSNDESTSNLCMGSSTNCYLVPTSITDPNGETLTLAYDYWTHCFFQTPPGQPLSPDDPIHCDYVPRLKSVTNNFGYQIVFSHPDARTGGNSNAPLSWYQRSGASFYNTGVSTTTPQSSVSYSYPSSGVTDITDIGGRVWRITDNSTLLAIRRPGASSDTTSYTRSGGIVSSVTNEGVTKSYSRSVSGNTATLTITDPLSKTKVITSDLTVGRPTSIQDELGRTTSYQYDSSGRGTRVTMPEGNYTQLTLDSRGNVTETRQVAKSGSGLSDIVTTAGFDTTCTNVKTCNQPNWTKDAKNNQTDYTYDSTHGGVLTITKPAPSSGAVRPQTRYSYTLTGGKYLLTGVSACQTLSSCAGGADEAKSTTTYDASGNVTAQSSGNGSGTLTATATMTYDAVGNLLTVDGPLSGSADTTRLRYNSARELVGKVSADPDGSGSLKMLAERNTYTNGLLTKREIGTVDSQSDTDWAAFSPAQTIDIGYWTDARPITQILSSGGNYFAYTHMNYDALGRLSCTATRMNPATWSSLPAACTPATAGSDGPDRITKNVYDDASQLVQVKLAVGLTDEAADRTMSYTNNGKLLSFVDGESNKTTYVYDGFDRLSQTQFPSSTKGSNSSNSNDYEHFGYDANSNVASHRMRDGNWISFSFDNLDRVTFKDLPGSEPDVTYAYDNLGRITSASQSGNALSFTYDALGRKLTEVGPQGTVSSQYDIAGRRTQVTYPGSGLYVNYDYLVTGAVSAVRENGATSGVGVLASYGYDNLGRRTSVTFGNGASQTFSFDGASRLASLTNDLSGTTNDLSVTFAYNPASQIKSTVRTGDTYAWAGHGAGTTSYSSNGLNQLTSIGGSSSTWDSKGNLTSEPQSGKTYCYSSENLLTGSGGTPCSSPSVALAYDPALRLYQVAGGSGTTRFAYDGANAIAEYDSSNALQRRFVFGPGVDQPIVQYDGSGTSNRTFMGSDERGSIVSRTDSAGSLININRYDEYGKPQSGNSGRFQYTGQKWISELSAYDYKARVYIPQLGIFAQSDPVGYRAGSNLYGYVAGDPVNSADPSGNSDTEISGNIKNEFPIVPEYYGNTLVQHSYDWSGQRATSVLDEQARVDALNAASTARWNSALAALQSCAISCLGTLEGASYFNAGLLDDTAEQVSNWFDRARRIGDAGENQIRQSFVSNGIPIYGSQVYIQTNYGLRIMDFIVGSRTGSGVMAVEVKTNGGYYSSSQRLKDWSLRTQGGYVRGGSLSDQLGIGTFLKIPTVVVRVWTTS